jgi:hypothetical protein
MGPAGPAGADGSDAEVGDLQEQIDALAGRIATLEGDPVVPPTFGATAKVLVAGAPFSGDPAAYDHDMLDMTVERPGVLSTSEKGHYSGGATIGFAGLGILDTGEDGAGAFGGWLEYNHFGIVLPASGGKGVFSVGTTTGANPAPQDAGKLKASWEGTMAGGRAIPVDPDNPDSDEMMPQILRGTATLDVTFEASGTGYSAAADLSITDVMSAAGEDLGDFMPYRTRDFTEEADGLLASNEEMDDPAYHAWKAMAIEGGAFKRRSIGYTDLFHSSDDVPQFVPATALNADPATADNYLAGRFYGAGGMEVGGVFHEDGSFTMGAVDGDDKPATMIGAFGATREGVLP